MRIDSSHMKYILVADVEGISKRTVRRLNKASVYTVKDLIDFYDSKEKLNHISGLGATSLSEIEQNIPKIYPGYLGINPCSSIDEVEANCFELISKLEQTIDELRKEIEIQKRLRLCTEEINDRLYKERRADQDLISSLRLKLKTNAEK